MVESSVEPTLVRLASGDIEATAHGIPEQVAHLVLPPDPVRRAVRQGDPVAPLVGIGVHRPVPPCGEESERRGLARTRHPRDEHVGHGTRVPTKVNTPCRLRAPVLRVSRRRRPSAESDSGDEARLGVARRSPVHRRSGSMRRRPGAPTSARESISIPTRTGVGRSATTGSPDHRGSAVRRYAGEQHRRMAVPPWAGDPRAVARCRARGVFIRSSTCSRRSLWFRRGRTAVRRCHRSERSDDQGRGGLGLPGP